MFWGFFAAMRQLSPNSLPFILFSASTVLKSLEWVVVVRGRKISQQCRAVMYFGNFLCSKRVPWREQYSAPGSTVLELASTLILNNSLFYFYQVDKIKVPLRKMG